MDDAYKKIIDDLVAGTASTGLPKPPDSDLATVPVLPLTVPAGFPRPPYETRRIVYFDLEIKNDLDAIGGWEGAKTHGGIGILCLWDSEDESPHFFDETTAPEACQILESASAAVSFNGTGFDLHVLQAATGRKISLQSHVDLFELARDQLDRLGKAWKGNGLDALSRNTIQRGKIGVGSDAPKLLRDGKWAQLANYCLRDVLLTRDLLTFCRRNGYILDKDGEALYLKLPEWLKLQGGTP
jgi:hypothetical protein